MKKHIALWFVFLLATAYAAQGSVIISYSLDKNVYKPGDYGTLYLVFQNPTAYPINNLDITVSEGKYIEISNDRLTLDNLPAGASQQSSVVFKINSSAIPVISEIKIHAEYYDYEQKKREYDVVVSVKIVDLPELKVSFKNASLALGETKEFCFELNNLGGEAREVKVSLNSSVFTISPNEFYFKKVRKSERLCAEISSIPESVAGIYPILAYLSYTDALSENTYTKTSVLWVKLHGKEKLLVYPESNKVENYINIVFSNAGNEKIKSLFVKLSSDIDVSPKEIYIGDLDVDDYDSERVSVSPIPGKHFINITAFYRDAFEKEHEENFVIEFVVPEKKEESDYTWIYALVVLIAIIFVWKFVKK